MGTGLAGLAQKKKICVTHKYIRNSEAAVYYGLPFFFADSHQIDVDKFDINHANILNSKCPGIVLNGQIV